MAFLCFHVHLRSNLLARCARIAIVLMTLCAGLASSAGDIAAARGWYQTLGFPDVTKLPYVRVATGLGQQINNKPWENTHVEGFLLNEGSGTFSVFICDPGSFTRFNSHDAYMPLTTVQFVSRNEGPEHQRVGFERIDLAKAAGDALARARKAGAEPFPGLRWGMPVSHRARLFAFAQGCAQNGLAEPAAALFELAANIPDNQTSRRDPGTILERLQQDIGEATLEQAARDCVDQKFAWADLASRYEHFAERFPASRDIAFAQESEALLKRATAEEAAHHPKPAAERSPAEEIAEDIYQLRNLHVFHEIQGHYPFIAHGPGQSVVEVNHLVDLGEAAVPALLEVIDDRRFTRSPVPDFHGSERTTIERVGDVAAIILAHISGQRFYTARDVRGVITGKTIRQKAEAWWADAQARGAKQTLVDATAAGGDKGLQAARVLIERYPEAALAAIEAGVRATAHDTYRAELVELAGKLPGEAALAFLRAELKADGLYTQVFAARALKARGRDDGTPAMLELWRKIQPRLPKNDDDVWSPAGYLISYLAMSGRAEAIEALASQMKAAPVDVRLACVQVFLPRGQSASMGANGASVHVDVEMLTLPDGEAGRAIERLLLAALDDRAARKEMKGHYKEISFEDPRICDFAALTLARRWPTKYQFQWPAMPKERDAQIATLREKGRVEIGQAPK